jgi:hypothetical protein
MATQASKELAVRVRKRTVNTALIVSHVNA